MAISGNEEDEGAGVLVKNSEENPGVISDEGGSREV